MTSNTYSFTPVRRRQADFEDDGSNVDSKYWTATRCNRLLRSLKSRIELLKKDAKQFLSGENSEEATNSTISTDTYRKRSHGALQSNNCGDGGLKPRKKVKVTYGGKSRSKVETGRCVADRKPKSTPVKRGFPSISRPPGEILVETPVLTRNRLEEGMSRASAVKVYGLVSPARKEEPSGRSSVSTISNFRSDTTLKLLQLAMSPKTYTLYTGIYNALETLLRSTAAAQSQAPERSNSLFSLCLRNVHQRIQIEEDWESGLKSTLQTRDISGEIYTQLEDFGTSDLGWKYLRVVVRAHGVQIVADAVSNGLVNRAFAESLVMLCSNMGSYREAETILGALLHTLPSIEPATTYSRIADFPELAPLHTLETYVSRTGRTPKYFSTMTEIFGGGVVPIQWLATKEFSGLWARVFRAISNEPPCQSATEFLQAALPLMLNASARQSKGDASSLNAKVSVAIGTAFSSVLATLSAVVILDEISESKKSIAHTNTERGRNVINVLRHLHIEYSILSTELRGQATLVFLANLLAMPLRDAGAKQCLQIIRLLQQACQSFHGTVDSEISEFMCSVARFCGRGLSDSGLEHFKRFSLLVEACSSTDEGQNYQLLRNIIVSSAYEFSQQAPIAAHLDYADDVRAKFQTIHPLSPGKSPNTQAPVSFRWEEGISEWVAQTPALPNKQRMRTFKPNQQDYFEVDSPVQTFRKIRKLQAPSFPTKREDVLSQRLAGRVSDLIPSSPSTYGSDGMMGYDDEGDTVFSDMTPPPRAVPPFNGRATSLNSPMKSRKLRNARPGSLQHSGNWVIYDETTNNRDEDDTDEEDELSSAYVLPEQKLLEVESNSRLSVGGHSRMDITRGGKETRQIAEDVDFSGDELSF